MKSLRFAIACACVSLSVPSIARAQTASETPSIKVEGCSNVSAGEVTRLLTLELAVWGEAPPEPDKYKIAIRCGADSATILLTDEFVRERLRRSLPLDQQIDQAPARTLANATAELLHALNWVVPQEQTKPAASQPNAPAVPPEASKPTPRTVSPEGPPQGSSNARANEFGVGLSPMFMVRSLKTKALYQPGLGALIRSNWSPNWGLGLAGDWSRGRVEKVSGTVHANSWAVGMMLLAKWPTAPKLFAEVRVGILARHVALRGDAREANVLGESISGFAPDLLVQVGPAARFSDLQVTLLGNLGFTLSPLQGDVTADTSLHYGGLWLGGSLEFAWYALKL